MAWSPKGICAVGMVVIISTPLQLLTAQQVSFQGSGFQTSFFAPASVRPSNNTTPSVTDLDHLPYLRQLARDHRQAFSSLKPTASDL